MLIQIDFNSDEAIYMQLRNQIIYAIANEDLRQGESLPSVRQLAEEIGINMHTVNKAYALLKQEGFLKLDRRRGATISIDFDKIQAISDLQEDLTVLLARAFCRNVTKEEAIKLVSDIYDEFGGIVK